MSFVKLGSASARSPGLGRRQLTGRQEPSPERSAAAVHGRPDSRTSYGDDSAAGDQNRSRPDRGSVSGRPRSRLTGFGQGFLCNATNPKILVFYLALLPQFVGSAAPWWVWLVHAWILPLLGTCWCLLVVVGVDRARKVLGRRHIRRGLDALTGTVLLGFCAKLATEN